MTTTPTLIHPVDIATLVDIAQRVVPPMWGLDGFVVAGESTVVRIVEEDGPRCR